MKRLTLTIATVLALIAAALAANAGTAKAVGTPCPANAQPPYEGCIHVDAAAEALRSRWIKNWCSVKPGMTRAAAIKLMGAPNRVPQAGTSPALIWDDYDAGRDVHRYTFIAGLNVKTGLIAGTSYTTLDPGNAKVSYGDTRTIPCAGGGFFR